MVNQYYGLKLQELCEAKEITKNEIIKKEQIWTACIDRSCRKFKNRAGVTWKYRTEK